MYDLQSYLGKMSAGMVSSKKLNQAKYGKPKKKKRNKVHHKQTFISSITLVGNLQKTICLNIL